MRSHNRPWCTTTSSYSVSHKFSFLNCPSHCTTSHKVKKPHEKESFFWKKDPNPLHHYNANLRIGWSNCWKLSQIKMVICMVPVWVLYWLNLHQSTSHIFIKVKNFVRSVVFFLTHFQIKVGNTLFPEVDQTGLFVNCHKCFLTKYSVANTYNRA